MKDELKCNDDVCETGDSVSDRPISEPKPLQNRLLYFGDPMCSWCWGITNHLDKIKNEFANQIGFELILGGLRPGGGDQWTPSFREMIKGHWRHVQEASGQPFDYSFFEREEFNYNTEPSARAVRVVRDLAPDKEWLFYKSLQHLFYAKNQDISDIKVMLNLCKELSIDATQFETLFLSPGYKQLVIQDFSRARQFGISGFPSVVLQKGEEYFAVARGYSSFEQMKMNVDSILLSK